MKTTKFTILFAFVFVLGLYSNAANNISVVDTLYFTHSGIKKVDMAAQKTYKYYVYKTGTSANQKILSNDGGINFEGYIYFNPSTDAWVNIGFVKPDLNNWYDTDLTTDYLSDGGWRSDESKSYGTFTLKQENATTWNGISGTEFTKPPYPACGGFPSVGPWLDWFWVNGRTDISQKGIWKFNLNTITKELKLQETQWAICGSATNNVPIQLKYNSTTKVWSINGTGASTSLSVGTFAFVTVPILSTDPVLSYGALEVGKLSDAGYKFTVTTAGSYSISMNLSTALNYTYSTTPSVGISTESLTTAIERNPESKFKVRLSHNRIRVDLDAPANVVLYSTTGEKIYSVQNATLFEKTINSGIYIICINQECLKITVPN